MKLKFSIIAVAAITVLILIIVSGQQGCSDWSECFTNADCVKVQITCCPCEIGGTERCVPKILAPLYEEKLKDCLPEEERICYNINNCKIKTCLCEKGRCFEKT